MNVRNAGGATGIRGPVHGCARNAKVENGQLQGRVWNSKQSSEGRRVSEEVPLARTEKGYN